MRGKLLHLRAGADLRAGPGTALGVFPLQEESMCYRIRIKIAAAPVACFPIIARVGCTAVNEAHGAQRKRGTL
jgi:hypothetical protein